MPSLHCPSCNSQKMWKDGIRYTGRGNVQRYICRECGHRFSETTWNGSDPPEYVQKIHRKPLNSGSALPYNRQVCVAETQGAKNLAEVEARQEAAQREGAAGIKGKIFEYAWWKKKNGSPESTIKVRVKILRRLAKETSLYDPEAIKELLARKTWSNGYKNNVVYAYSDFLNFIGSIWEPPVYKPDRSLPFIPTEEEIDQLIAGCGKKMATFLQGLKEAGADPGELHALRWVDVNFENRSVAINHPVKGHDSRIIKVSQKFLDMISSMPKVGEKVFNNKSIGENFYKQRQRLAFKLGNPRLLHIHFTTLRHWKGTMEYHRTKDILHVKRLLGHKLIQNTMVYINLEQAYFQEKADEFHVKVARNIEEACKFVAVGFEYVTGEYMDGGKIFRKRK